MLLHMEKYGRKLPIRGARAVGAKYGSVVIALPQESRGLRYHRYIDDNTGIITLIPVVEEDRRSDQDHTTENGEQV